MIRAAVRRPRGILLPQGACPAGMHPPFSFPTCGKENGPCTVQKKRPLGRAPVQWPSALTGVGVPVPAPILPSLRARFSLLQVCNCRPVADGADLVGVVVAWSCFSFRYRSRSREESGSA